MSICIEYVVILTKHEYFNIFLVLIIQLVNMSIPELKNLELPILVNLWLTVNTASKFNFLTLYYEYFLNFLSEF